MSVQKDEILDREALVHLRAIAGSPADNVSVRFVHLFLEEAVSMIDTMRRAATAGDCAQVAMTAHALRGPSIYISFQQVLLSGQ